jgi:hypothetical protein
MRFIKPAAYTCQILKTEFTWEIMTVVILLFKKRKVISPKLMAVITAPMLAILLNSRQSDDTQWGEYSPLVFMHSIHPVNFFLFIFWNSSIENKKRQPHGFASIKTGHPDSS